MFRKTVVVVMMMIAFTACTQGPKEDLIQTTYAIGTVININLYDQGDQDLMNDLIARVSEIEGMMSSQKSTSEVSEVTRQAGIAPVKVSPETYKVVKRALYYASLSNGSFDPTIGPIVKLWGIGTEEARVPDEGEIEEALKLVDYTKVRIDDTEQTVFLENVGMSLDLGGIAKGYVADELVVMLDEAQVERAMINLGGNIYAYGEKAEGEAYKIAIQTPYDNRNTYFGYVSLKNKTVVTSGPYERYFEEDGQIYHHIFNANTGYPVQSDVASVSIIAEQSMDGDALATLLFTMSPEEGLALIGSIEGVECIYVDKSFNLRVTDGLTTSFTLTDDTYKLSQDN